MPKLITFLLFWLGNRAELVGNSYWFIRCRDCWRAFDACSPHQSVFVCPRCLARKAD